MSSPTPRTPAASTGICALTRKRTPWPAISPARASTAPKRQSPGSRRTTSTAFSVPTRPTSSSIRRGRRSAGSQGSWRSERSPARACASSRTSASRRRASTATTSGSSGAPIKSRRATGCSGATKSPGSTSAASGSTSISGAAHNLDGDRLNLGGNVNAHWSFKNNWSTGFGINRELGSFDDRATRGGPGANYEGNWNSGATSTPTSASGSPSTRSSAAARPSSDLTSSTSTRG